MNLYPYTSPIILTDAIFLAYGGMTGSSVASQRTASYFIAEQMVSEDINTLLLPTIVTGTHLAHPLGQPYTLDYGYVNKIHRIDWLDVEGTVCFSETNPSSIYFSMLDDELGFIAVNTWWGCGNPHKIRVVYDAGLPSGTSYQANVLLALTTMAGVFLNEIIGYGNEGVGDIGIQNFRNQQYYEERKFLLRTTFGTSAKAQFVWKLLSPLRKYRQVGL